MSKGLRNRFWRLCTNWKLRARSAYEAVPETSMSSEIVTGSATPATPVLWRKVSLLSREKPKRHSARRDGEEELKSRLDQARREGMEQGREAGLQESEQQVPAILQNFARAQAELAGTAEQIRIETARDLV